MHVALTVLGLASVIFMMSALKFELTVMPAVVMFGISVISFFPTCLSYGAELTFPLQPALVNACMNFMG